MAKPEYIDRKAFLDYMKGTSRYFNVKFDIETFPAADVVSIEVLKKWLYENALNNAGSSYGFACVEISKRLDGLRRYANECREENK